MSGSGGKAYNKPVGHSCDRASRPKLPPCPVREYHSGQCVVSADAKRSTCAIPYRIQIWLTTSALNLHSPGSGPVLERMSAALFSTPGMCTALSEDSRGQAQVNKTSFPLGD